MEKLEHNDWTNKQLTTVYTSMIQSACFECVFLNILLKWSSEVPAKAGTAEFYYVSTYS